MKRAIGKAGIVLISAAVVSTQPIPKTVPIGLRVDTSCHNYQIAEAPEALRIPERRPVVKIEKEAPKKLLNEADFKLVCRVVAAEARGESYDGKAAVAQVILDRMQHKNTKLYGGPTASGVVLKKYQFAKPWKGDLSKYPEVAEVVDDVFNNGYRVFEETTVAFFHVKIANRGAVRELRRYNYVGKINVHEFRGDKLEH